MSEDECYKIFKTQKVKIQSLACPENQMLWTPEHPQSNEFKEMMNEVNAIVSHLVNLVNLGPEVSENSAKRVMVAKAIIKTFITYMYITPIDRLGILEAIKDDLNSETRVGMLKKALDDTLNKHESETTQKDTSKKGQYVS